MRVLWLEDLIRCTLEHASTVEDILLPRGVHADSR